MPKVIYKGPTNELVVDDITLTRDGEEVELTEDQIKRARDASLDVELEVGGKAVKHSSITEEETPNTASATTSSAAGTTVRTAPPVPPVQPAATGGNT